MDCKLPSGKVQVIKTVAPAAASKLKTNTITFLFIFFSLAGEFEATTSLNLQRASVRASSQDGPVPRIELAFNQHLSKESLGGYCGSITNFLTATALGRGVCEHS